MTDASPQAEDFAPGRPIVFRNGIVITVDTPGVILDGDVLITGDTITAVGTALPVPEGTVEIDASGGILMPGMIDTHRHMWQSALRGYGGDWALSQYFVFYYLSTGQSSAPRTSTPATCSAPSSRSTPVSRRRSTGRTRCGRRITPRPRCRPSPRSRGVSCSATATTSEAPGTG